METMKTPKGAFYSCSLRVASRLSASSPKYRIRHAFTLKLKRSFFSEARYGFRAELLAALVVSFMFIAGTMQEMLNAL